MHSVLNQLQLKRLLSDRTSAGAVVQTCVANILIQGANVLSGIVTARALGPGGRGELAAIIMWPQFLAYALTLGIPVASVYQIRRRPQDEGAIAATALFSSVVMGLVAAVVGLIVIPFSLHSYSSDVVHFAMVAVLTAPLSLFGVTLSVQAQSAGSFRHYNLFRFSAPVLILGTLFVEWRAGLLAPKTAALAYLLAGIPVTAWNLVWVWRRFRLRVAMHVEQLKNLLSYGVRAWGADLIGTVANQVDRLMVVGLLAPQLMGLYVVAQSAANLLNVLPAAMVPVLLPKAVDRSTEEIVQLTGRAARVTLLVLLAAGLPLILLGGFLLHLFYGAKFAGSTGVLRLLVIESVLDGVTYVLSQAFLAAGIPGTVALLQGVGLVSAIPLLAFFVPRWGLMGAGLAVLIATAARLAFVLGNFVVRLKSRPPSLLLSPSDFVTLMRRG